MRITKFLCRNRRDFNAILVCEGCGHEEVLNSGYDDRNYHDNVIPEMKCKTCGKSQIDLGEHNMINLVPGLAPPPTDE